MLTRQSNGRGLYNSKSTISPRKQEPTVLKAYTYTFAMTSILGHFPDQCTRSVDLKTFDLGHVICLSMR